MAKPDRKDRWVSNAPTATLKRISNSLSGQEKPESEFPLAGIVHIGGIGQVRVSAIRAELERRAATENEKYVIQFTYDPGVVLYAGFCKDNSLGFAPTVKTAIQTDMEAAERFLQNGYGELGRTCGKVVLLSDVEK